mgnify:CR=1 FL=1
MQVKELNDIINECRRFAKKEIREQALEADLNPSPTVLQKVTAPSLPQPLALAAHCCAQTQKAVTWL